MLDLRSQAVDAEDLADEIEILSGGVMDQRFPEVQELVGFHLPDLVADDVAEGARLAARGGLPMPLGERRQDIQLVGRSAPMESSTVWDSSCKRSCVILPFAELDHFQLVNTPRNAQGFQCAARQSNDSRLLQTANARRPDQRCRPARLSQYSQPRWNAGSSGRMSPAAATSPGAMPVTPPPSSVAVVRMRAFFGK